MLLLLIFLPLVLIAQLRRWLTVDDGSLDAGTRTLLQPQDPRGGPAVVHEDCVPIVTALETAELTDDEPTCAKQMRAIVGGMHLPYRSLVAEPETLLRCSKGMIGTNGALWTRFTVQYNLYAGSIVALGSDEQREQLFATQEDGQLGCFAFTEKGAGVLSGAGVETTATYDADTQEFVIHSPTPSSLKNWISQGCYAENAVILAELFIDGKSHGPHLFWSRIANAPASDTARPEPLAGVQVESLPEKTALLGLDNATIAFDQFRIPRSALLSRFASVSADGNYALSLPARCSRMLDLLISRLLTGRIVLSEGNLSFVLSRMRHNWQYCVERELWRGRKPQGRMMAEMPLVRLFFRDYSRTVAMVAHFIEHTRERVADAIRNDTFSNDLVEATCMCKYVGTSLGVDTVSALRKLMGARGLQAESKLGAESLAPNASCTAEGDNTIMELKIVQDIVRGRTAKFPVAMMLRCCSHAAGRLAVWAYVTKLARAMVLGRSALKDGRLLRDLAWARAHMRVLDVWQSSGQQAHKQSSGWTSSYQDVAMRFPAPIQV